MQLLEVIMRSIRIGDLELAHRVKVEERFIREVVSANLKQEADAFRSEHLLAKLLEGGPRSQAGSCLVVNPVLVQKSAETLCLRNSGQLDSPLTPELSRAAKRLRLE